MLPRVPYVRSLCLSVPLVCGLALSACGSGGTGAAANAASHAPGSHAARSASSTSEASVSVCRPVGSPSSKGQPRVPRPSRALDPGRRYVVHMATNCGAISIALDVRQAPRTTASFAYLVRRGFYDRLTFHRVAAGFVIQGGDPAGDGSGGPGYTVVEPPPPDVRYTRGTVAMAKTAAQPAGASGSQFFIVTGAQAPLPAQYALVGHVVGDLGAVRAIAQLPTYPPQDGVPRTPVVISHATVSVG